MAWIREGMGARFAGLGPFAAEAMAEYERCLALPGSASAVCEDYRASATIDLEHDRADRREAPTQLPGHFGLPDEQPQLLLGQKRREMGRLGSGRVEEEAPVSMFDLTRSAARAFSRNAFPLGGGQASEQHAPARGSGESARGMDASVDSLGSAGSAETEQQRVRRRDMVANAVSGGLTSGLGWVLGATPVDK